MEVIMSCGTGLLAGAIVLLGFVVLGMLIDPEGMVEWANDLKRFYFGDKS